MSETLEYIDAYFTEALNEEERKQFEARCVADEAFAKDVAFYIMAREEARQSVIKQKQQWKENAGTVNEMVAVKPAKRSIVLQWMPYAAAACLVFVMAFYFLYSSNNSRQLANRFIEEKYSHLSLVMDASSDSMQLGMDAYNKKDYKKAVTYFNGLRMRDSLNSDAKRFAGVVYLQLKDYDKALHCFQELSAMKGFSNSGDFLQATTLLERNANGDKEAAKALLEKVVKENEDENDIAKRMLEKW